MDRFAAGMTARGPTLEADRETWTGSLHIVDLPGEDAARDFVDREPYSRAGLFARHEAWHFTNLLGRTMWDFAGTTDDPLHLAIAHAREGSREGDGPVPTADLPPELAERLIVYGELRATDDGRPAGVALALPAPSPATLDSLLRDERAGLGGHELEAHDWEFGGRR